MSVSGPGARDDLIDLDFAVYANAKVVCSESIGGKFVFS